VAVTGLGKSGLVGRKIAATLSSTGTPAFFLHPVEGAHGDIGMIRPEDVILAISNSGETDELNAVLPTMRTLGVCIVGLTGNEHSSLAGQSDIVLKVHVPKEACPFGLAPTASTTAQMALGDALAVALLDARGFREEDFARSHPGGALGRRLLLHVGDLAHRGTECPRVHAGQSLVEGLLEMTRTGLGIAVVVEQEDPSRVLGVFTDGDLRRVIEVANRHLIERGQAPIPYPAGGTE